MTVMLYRSPGPNKRPDGSYEFKVVEPDQIEAEIANGWHRSAADAVANKAAPTEPQPTPAVKKAKAKAKKDE